MLGTLHVRSFSAQGKESGRLLSGVDNLDDFEGVGFPLPQSEESMTSGFHVVPSLELEVGSVVVFQPSPYLQLGTVKDFEVYPHESFVVVG